MGVIRHRKCAEWAEGDLGQKERDDVCDVMQRGSEREREWEWRGEEGSTN